MNSILYSIKQKALNEHIPIVMDDTLDVIINYIKADNPKRLLEIGTAVGYSSICFAQYMSKDSIIDTIEQDEEKANQALENVKKMNLEDKINIIQGNAVEILPNLQEKYDMIFIDAAKGKYPIFLQEAIRLSKNNAIILADNVLYKGYVLGDYNKHKQKTAVTHLREYLKLINDNQNLESQILEVGDGLAISRVKNISTTIYYELQDMS